MIPKTDRNTEVLEFHINLTIINKQIIRLKNHPEKINNF